MAILAVPLFFWVGLDNGFELTTRSWRLSELYFGGERECGRTTASGLAAGERDGW
jgi:hypothetical protein